MSEDVARFFWHVLEQLPVSERQAYLDSLPDDKEAERFLQAVKEVMPTGESISFTYFSIGPSHTQEGPAFEHHEPKGHEST